VGGNKIAKEKKKKTSSGLWSVETFHGLCRPGGGAKCEPGKIKKGGWEKGVGGREGNWGGRDKLQNKRS